MRRGSFNQTGVVSRLVLRESRISCRRLRRVMFFGALERELRVRELLLEGFAVRSFPGKPGFDLGLSFGRLLSRGVLLGRLLSCGVLLGRRALFGVP